MVFRKLTHMSFGAIGKHTVQSVRGPHFLSVYTFVPPSSICLKLSSHSIAVIFVISCGSPGQKPQPTNRRGVPELLPMVPEILNPEKPPDGQVLVSYFNILAHWEVDYKVKRKCKILLVKRE